MKKDLFNEFCNVNSDFSEELKALEEKHRITFEKKLKEEKQKINFLSKISEFRFAQFLQSENLSFEYEPEIENKKPDFKINFQDKSTCYFDVKRFNVSDNDRKNNEFLYLLSSKLETIQKPLYLHIEQLADLQNIDINQVYQEIEKWIYKYPINIGDIYTYGNSLRIEILQTEGKSNHILYGLSHFEPTIHPAKIKSIIVKKLKCYNETIIKKGFPFFVAIDLSFDTLISPEEYWLYFLGRSCENISKSESFFLGEFYIDEELNDLAGLMIKCNRKFYWLKNPRNKFRIEFNNVESQNIE